MDFREWITDIEKELWPVLQRIKLQVLQSVQVENGRVRFSIPPLEHFFQQKPLSLAAHTIHQGDIIDEGYKQQHPYGKAGLAFKAIDQSRFAQEMTPKQATDFQKGFSSNINRLSKDMGLLFELQIFIYLIDVKRLKPGAKYKATENAAWAHEQIQNIVLEIQKKSTSKTVSQKVVQFVAHHAEDMAESIYQTATKLLRGCTVDFVEFAGGQHTTTYHRKTADLYLGCSKSMQNGDKVGFSTKFASETLMVVGEMRVKSAYQFLGGTKANTFEKQLQNIEDAEEYRQFLLDTIEDLAHKLTENPRIFSRAINELLFGVEVNDSGRTGIANTIPAFRNYVRNKGKAEFSPALKSDFNINPSATQKLSLKPNSEINISRTKAYITINIKSQGGTRTGTTIRIEPSADGIIFKMNNVASDQ